MFHCDKSDQLDAFVPCVVIKYRGVQQLKWLSNSHGGCRKAVCFWAVNLAALKLVPELVSCESQSVTLEKSACEQCG